MDSSLSVACGFLGGTILSVPGGGYRVLQHPRPERVFDRIADARWYLAVSWCDRHTTPAAILTHDGQFSFQNQATLEIGATRFLPLNQRQAVFHKSLVLKAGESIIHTVPILGDTPLEMALHHRSHHQVQVLSVEIDPRYGKVALLRALEANT